MASYRDACDRWIEVALGRTDKSNYRRTSRNKIFAIGDSIYSYGTHFEMGRVLRDAKGKPRGWLLNGDRYSNTTSGHQSRVRGALAVADTGLPSVIIPYEALGAAGVDLDSVEIIEATSDRFESIEHVMYEQPPRSVWEDVPQYKDVKLTDEELDALVAQRNADNVAEWERRKRDADELGAESYWGKWLENHPEPLVTKLKDIQSWDRVERRQVGTKRVLYRAKGSYRQIDVKVLSDGRTRYSWTTGRHWLGESLVRAKIPRTGMTTCKDCEGTGRITPDPLDQVDAANFDRDSDFWAARREAQLAGVCPTCDGIGGKRWTRNRTAYFLSGFDQNERLPVYFFCELPKGVNPTTVAEAYEDLKPESVKVAEQMGRTIWRQGDIFAIELPGLTKRELRKRGARFEKRGNLLRTNHEATEVAYLPDGSTLVRGTLWHNPGFRAPDHRRVTVGKSWHLAVKNTVPISV